jgi:murein L,D-transpeptidase YcbB/YkuD
MPENLGEFYVWDNVPEYMTHLIKNGEVIHSAKIVVGKVDTPTAIFSADMKHIIFHPEWGVPDSIKVKEILPYLRPTSSGLFGLFGGGTDTRILERHNLKVSYNGRPIDASQIDWSRVDIRQYTFIQPGGGSNVLGAVKFRFPNKYDIYMHDTPERQLFGGSTRAFSHGCMRVQDPGRFAEVLLAEDKGWSAAHVQHLMAEGYNNEVELSHPIPVHVTYFTEIVGDDGTVKHFGDPYGYDGRVSQALLGKPLSPSKDAETASDSSATGVREIRRVKARNSTGDGASHDPFSGLFGN